MFWLTKTKYLSGLQCHKRIWTELRAPHQLQSASAAEKHVMEQGIEVGRLAQRCFPDGQLIAASGNEALVHTDEAMQAGVPCLFEAGFVWEDIYIRCDVLRRAPEETWELIEVKASTQARAHHLDDLAIQCYVLLQNGIRVSKVSLMHIDSKADSYKELDDLFALEDLTRRVIKHLKRVPQRLEAIRAILAQNEEPPLPIGSHCSRPYKCPVKEHCWQSVPEESIFTIPRLSRDKKDELVGRGIYHLRDLPEDYPLSAAQRSYVARALSGKVEIDHGGIKRRLATLKYPIHFFDFETCGSALPRYTGVRPYQQVPFQYSCHTLHADGRVEHKGYLHGDESDPRPRLATALVRDLGKKGSVVVYNARFEQRILWELAEALPARRQQLQAIRGRIWDQLVIFRKHYADPKFLGSNSIKNVLPVVVPSLTYDDLSVQKGDDAQAIWVKMIRCRDDARKAEMCSNLWKYCQRDTEAMLEIHRVLMRLIE